MNSKKKVCKVEAKAIDNLFSWKSFEAICKTILAQKAKSQAQEQLKEYFSFPAKVWIFLMVFCYQNCSDLLLEKIVLVIEKNFWDCKFYTLCTVRAPLYPAVCTFFTSIFTAVYIQERFTNLAVYIAERLVLQGNFSEPKNPRLNDFFLFIKCWKKKNRKVGTTQ